VILSGFAHGKVIGSKFDGFTPRAIWVEMSGKFTLQQDWKASKNQAFPKKITNIY
jgi:hypothetical protein